jgi:hypothetical protein
LLLQANASHAMARHWPGCGRSGTPPTPFTAGRCYCPPQAEVFVKIGERDPATPPCPPAIASCCLQAGIILLPSPSCLLRRHVFSLAGGTPAPPVSLLIHQGACRPLDPLLMGKFGPRVSLYLSLSAPPSSHPNCVCATFFSVMSSAWRGKPPHLLSAFLFTKGCAAPWTPCCWR